ncbi:MAG TPA: hypothetical protein VFN05_10775 [Actinomycetes bacterium]|nr:hypothetical protein [Actinomycetes bacterium]
MRAFTLDCFDTPPGLRDDLPEPEPEPEAGPGQLLVRVQASSVNPVDALIAPAPGSSGGVPAMAPAVGPGAWAELVAVPAESVAPLPDGADLGQAGAAPWAGLTALAAADALGLGQAVSA